jgi:surface carbohydrate biosynthesis protein
MNKINIYIPIEDELRETYSKIYLACFLADKGYKVYVMKNYLLPKFKWEEGIILGKNHLHVSALSKKTRKNYSFVLIEEEGADAIGDLERRINKVFGRVNHAVSENAATIITQWGKWQAKAAETFFKISVKITGSLYIEVCKEKYNRNFKELNNFITKGYDDYILINTRFALINCNYAPHVSVANKNPDFAYDKANPDYWRNLTSNQMLLLGSFITLIQKIGDEFKNKTIVLRPHPGENIDFYKELFKDYKNIVVENEGFVLFWIRNARCIITNGCTTSLQAEVAHKPVINYVPTYNVAMSDFSLFDDIGSRVNSIDGVIRDIHKTYNNDFTNFNIGLWQDKEETFSLRLNFFEKILDIIFEESNKIKATDNNLKNSYFNIKLYELKLKIKQLLKIDKKFKDNDLQNFSVYYEGIRKNFKDNLRANKIFENCYCIETEK